MNSLNLRQIDGGNVIKQADFGSNLSFELLDERRRKIPELDGQTATIRLIKGDNIAYQIESQVVDGTVSFKFEKVLEKGIYVLEIVADNYVFPSNNMVKITIEKTAGNYKPENMVKTDLVELQGKITAIEQREHDVNQELLDVGQKQAEMTKRIETLESREDNDTIYDDTKIKQSIANVDNKVSGLSEKVTALEERPIVDTALTERVEALERKEDKDTVYDDTPIIKRIETLEDKPDNDTIYDDSNLKAQISELQEKLKSLNTVRHAPTGYTLDRTTIPWTVRFDNGCELRFPKNSPTSERDKANLIYGYGFPANNNSTVAFSAPIPPLIISASRGVFTVDKFKESDEAHFHITYADYRLYYPIRKSDDFNWENAYGDRVNQTVSTNGKSNFAKLMYELGIWSESDVLYLGATKK